MTATTASKLAADWSSRKQLHAEDDLKGMGLPLHVREAILDVEANSKSIADRVALAEELWATQPDHELALEPGNHPQTTWAQRFELVGGEVLEITKDSYDSPVKLTVRPDLKAGDQVDPAAALQAHFQSHEPVESAAGDESA